VQIRLVQGLPEQLLSEGISILPKTDNLLVHYTNEEANYINKKFEKDNIAILRNWPTLSVAVKGDIKENDVNTNLEKIRQQGADIQELLAKEKATYTRIYDFKSDANILLALLEGIFLSSYSFQKYKSEKAQDHLQVIEVFSETVTEIEIEHLQNLCEAVCIARDLVNEPLIGLNAEDLANRAVELGKEKGFSVTVFNKSKISELGMGGLLAINAGSLNPPTFSILEYKPKNSTNSKPIVLVGKGVVYDTGGLSLKPTPNSMDFMKCDMGGAATVIGTICALAENKTPVHVIGLIPATENRPDGNAITPGDIVTMYNGKTVEIMNTDAEGRMILADALAYATQYDPALVIDIATLTGSAVAAIGSKGIVYMGTASAETKKKIEAISMEVHERLVEFPLWDEYGKYLESDIADLKNLGGSDSGAISAGKFLEHFVSYPWLHLDIAAMAFLHSKEGYRIKGGTGVGIRLLYNFISSKA
jgi:leucyl aminopeptidase